MVQRRLVAGVLHPLGPKGAKQHARIINTRSQRKTEPLVYSKLDGLLSSKHPKICVYRRLGGIGDVIMTTPMVKHIKRLIPSCHLVYATDLEYSNGALGDVLRGNPFIDEIASFKDVAAKDFDLFTDVTATGLDKEKPNTTPPNRIDLFARQLGVDVSMDPVPTYIVSADEKEWAERRVEEFALPRNRDDVAIIGIQVRSNDQRRTWPIEHTRKLIEMLTRDPQVRIILFSWDSNDNWKMPQVFVAGESLRYTAALVNECDVMVTPDSSLLHLAGALQKKTVTIFGPIPPESRINHYHNTTAIVAGMSCQYCWYQPTCGNKNQCLSEIEPPAVASAIMRKLEEDEEVREVISVNTGKGTGFRPDNVILVKRHHGGFGDIMMTLPGIEKLKDKYPSKKIYYALPPKYHCVAEGSPYIDKVLDSTVPIQNNRFSIVMDISNPCAQYEAGRVGAGKTVELNRVEIFSKALGTRELLDNIRPKYYPKEEDIEWAKEFLPETDKLRIGIVLRPADVYREWPREKFEQLVPLLTENFQCVILDQVRDFLIPGVVDGCGFQYEKAAALAMQCDIIFTPNSSFLALSAAHNIPTVTTFGPLDPNAICKMHDSVTVVRSSCIHMPCWRNNVIPCRISGSAEGTSECMKTIGVKDVYEAIMETARKIS